MLSFCGQYNCLIDANGRLKLPPKFIEDFTARGGDVVLYALPEGAVAVYPEEVYREIRGRAFANPAELASSMLARRELRRFGALAAPDRITRQGRLTLPSHLREAAGLAPGAAAVLIGTEIGVEIWNAERWTRELGDINDHLMRRGEAEASADLRAENVPAPGNGAGQ